MPKKHEKSAKKAQKRKITESIARFAPASPLMRVGRLQPGRIA
jgi:hypothetical protein